MNDNIISQFDLLEKQIIFELNYNINSNTNKYRLVAVRQIIDRLKKINHKIISSEQLTNIKKIGKHTLQRVDEILQTGKLKEIYISNDQLKYINFFEKLTEIYGIGNALAYKLIKNNITNAKQLETAIKNKEISVPQAVIKGLKYLNKIDINIPHDHIKEFEKYILGVIKKIDTKLIGMICGSYRREKQISGDVDFIITHPDFKDKNINYHYIKQIIDVLKHDDILIDSLTDTDVKTKYMGIFKWHNKLHRIDIRCVPFKSWNTAILYFTGSKSFNQKIRLIANSYNYTLNEYELYDGNLKKSFLIKSEKDIFDILNMKYLDPKDRT
jgi:DNA polymerase/3'-5' exonuclease PolX